MAVKLVSALVLTLITGAFGSMTVPVTAIDRVGALLLASETVFEKEPAFAPVRRTYNGVAETTPELFVRTSELVNPELAFVETAKFTASFAVTVTFSIRFVPLTCTDWAVPAPPRTADKPAMRFVLTAIDGPGRAGAKSIPRKVKLVPAVAIVVADAFDPVSVSLMTELPGEPVFVFAVVAKTTGAAPLKSTVTPRARGTLVKV